jgi:hypothetical protein
MPQTQPQMPQPPLPPQEQTPPPPPPIPAASNFEIAAAGQRVVLSGRGIEATADRLSMAGDKDSLLLEGNVEVHCRNAHFRGDRLSIRLSDGTIEVGAPPPPPVPSVTPCYNNMPIIF